jgi:hypothetical protein
VKNGTLMNIKIDSKGALLSLVELVLSFEEKGIPYEVVPEYAGKLGQVLIYHPPEAEDIVRELSLREWKEGVCGSDSGFDK